VALEDWQAPGFLPSSAALLIICEHLMWSFLSLTEEETSADCDQSFDWLGTSNVKFQGKRKGRTANVSGVIIYGILLTTLVDILY
jgi:hypothetical protein